MPSDVTNVKECQFSKSRLSLIDSISAGFLFGRGIGRERNKRRLFTEKGERTESKLAVRELQRGGESVNERLAGPGRSGSGFDSLIR